MNFTQRRPPVFISHSRLYRLLCSRPLFAALLAGTMISAGSLASAVHADTLEPETAASIPNPAFTSPISTAMPAHTDGAATSPPSQEDLLKKVEANSLDARLAKHGLKSNLDVESILQKHGLRSADNCQAALIPNPFPIAVRLGAALSPRVKFAGGVDYTIPSLSIGRGFSTRVDADAIVSANFGGITTLVPVTIDQVYRFSLPGGAGLYVGGGIGPYFGEVTRFGGKLFIGGEITPRFGLEGTIHFQGYGDPITTVQARFPF